MEPNLAIERSTIESEFLGLRSLTGGLIFVARCTRPGILYSVNYISRFQNCSNEQIFKYAKHILKYLVLIEDFGLTFESKGNKSCVTLVDASFENVCDEQYQSTTGFLTFSYGDLIHWTTLKQRSTATSTTELEFYVLNQAIHQSIFLKDIFAQIFEVRESI